MAKKFEVLPFIDDTEKIADMLILAKEDFLESYSYLTEEEYDCTVSAIVQILAAVTQKC